MKLAVLADIHANFQALQAVTNNIEQWQPDHVVVAGDTVNRGPRSLDCLNFVLSKQKHNGWLTVKGNHEDYVLSFARPNAVLHGPEFEIFRLAYWSYQQLNGHISTLDAMPFQVNLTTPDNRQARTVHASMLGTRSGIFSNTPNEQLRQKIRHPDQPFPALFCVGHTHIPLIRVIDNTLVVNVGAVGLPFDGDPRASYAQLTWQNGQWSAKIIRLTYDRQQAVRDFYETGFLDGGGPLTRLILNELNTAQSRLYQWVKEYQAPTLAGEITLEKSAARFLEKLG